MLSHHSTEHLGTGGICPYSMPDDPPPKVPSVKYLGLTVTHEMKWNNHVNNITAAADRTHGFVKRNLRVNSAKVKEQAYKALVRPKLEYCATVWDPKATSDEFTGSMRNHRPVNQIEMVQRRAARWVTGRYNNTSSVSDMLQSLGWRSLEQRRVDARLTMLYKITHGLVSTQLKDHLKYSGRNGKLLQPQTKTDYFKFSFLPRTIKQWRSLHPNVIDSQSVNIFKKRVQDITHERLI